MPFQCLILKCRTLDHTVGQIVLFCPMCHIVLYINPLEYFHSQRLSTSCCFDGAVVVEPRLCGTVSVRRLFPANPVGNGMLAGDTV